MGFYATDSHEVFSQYFLVLVESKTFCSRHVVDDGINDGDSGSSGRKSENAVRGSQNEVCVSRGMRHGPAELFGRVLRCTPRTRTHLLSRNMSAFLDRAHIHRRGEGTHEGKKTTVLRELYSPEIFKHFMLNLDGQKLNCSLRSLKCSLEKVTRVSKNRNYPRSSCVV